MSDEPVTGDDVRLGVELLVSDLVGLPPTGDGEAASEDDDYEPAAGRHRALGRWHRTVEFGKSTVEGAARVLGEQVSTVLRETLAGMERVPIPETAGTGLVVSSIQMTFGVKLTGGAGKVIEAVMSAGGEASVQVAVTLTRPASQ